MTSTPWKPTLDDAILPPCPFYDAVVSAGSIPSAANNPGWSRSEVYPTIQELVPERADEIWEVVLALWRLREDHENGGEHDIWRAHLSAWLHRYRDLCWETATEPLTVVMDFVEAAVFHGFLPAGMAPSFARESEGQDSDHVEDESEYEDKGSTHSEESTARNRAHVSPPRPSVEPVKVQPAGTQRGSKRPLPDSPSRVEGGKKKAKKVKIVVEQHRGTKHELGHLVVSEESPVDVEIVPDIKGRVCSQCTVSRSDEPCQLVWSYNRRREVKRIRCQRCIRGKTSCSFDLDPFGIKDWPKIVKSSKGEARRRLQNEKKGASNKKLGRAKGSKERSAPKSPGSDQESGQEPDATPEPSDQTTGANVTPSPHASVISDVVTILPTTSGSLVPLKGPLHEPTIRVPFNPPTIAQVKGDGTLIMQVPYANFRNLSTEKTNPSRSRSSISFAIAQARKVIAQDAYNHSLSSNLFRQRWAMISDVDESLVSIDTKEKDMARGDALYRQTKAMPHSWNTLLGSLETLKPRTWIDQNLLCRSLMDLWWSVRSGTGAEFVYLPLDVIHQLSGRIRNRGPGGQVEHESFKQGPFFAQYNEAMPWALSRRACFLLFRNSEAVRGSRKRRWEASYDHANHYFLVVFDFGRQTAYAFGADVSPGPNDRIRASRAGESGWERWYGPDLWEELAHALGWQAWLKDPAKIRVISKDWQQNGYDCGIYARDLTSKLMRGVELDNILGPNHEIDYPGCQLGRRMDLLLTSMESIADGLKIYDETGDVTQPVGVSIKERTRKTIRSRNWGKLKSYSSALTSLDEAMEQCAHCLEAGQQVQDQ